MDATGSDPRPTSGVGTILRIFWMFFGLGALALVAAVTARHGAGEPSWRDALFWALVLALVAARYLDVERYGGLTAEGKPASRADVRFYAVRLVGAALVLWGAMHASACAGL
jgi:hypothetical protein